MTKYNNHATFPILDITCWILAKFSTYGREGEITNRNVHVNKMTEYRSILNLLFLLKHAEFQNIERIYKFGMLLFWHLKIKQKEVV